MSTSSELLVEALQHVVYSGTDSLASKVVAATALVEAEAVGSEALKAAKDSIVYAKEARTFEFEELVDGNHFDTSGVLFGIGTGFTMNEYSNPSVSKAVHVQFSEDANNVSFTSISTPPACVAPPS